jgi:ribonuclease P protein component
MEQSVTRHTFRKEEKLCSKLAIEKLFSSGISFYVNPIKVLVLKTPSSICAPVKVLVSVPKKYIRQANDRNRIKRLIREAYRLNKQMLFAVNQPGYEWSIAFIYTSKQVAEFNTIMNLMYKILDQIVNYKDLNEV